MIDENSLIIDELCEEFQLFAGDRVHLDNMLRAFTAQEHQYIIQEYKSIWIAAAANEPNPIHKNNSARNAANKWIKSQIENLK